MRRWRRALAAWAVFGAASAAAEVPTSTASSALEEALFGGPSDDDANAADAAPTGDEGAEAGSLPRLLGTLAAQDDPLDIGGKLWLWAQFAAAEDAPVGDALLSNPNFADLYLDARPNDSVRAFVQGRLRHDLTVVDGAVDPLTGMEQPATRVQLDQYWLKLNLRQRVFVTAGRQRLKWGAGRFWNPTDFVNRQRLAPLDFLDLRLGVPLVKVHVPIEAEGINLYAIALLEGVRRARDAGGILRAEWAFSKAELSATIAGQERDGVRLGADASVGVGDFDLKLEGALVDGKGLLRLDGTYDLDDLSVPPSHRPGGFVPQLVASVEWGLAIGDEDSLLLGAEYFYNGAGYDDAAYYPSLLIHQLRTGQSLFTPLYLGRHYGGLSAVMIGPGNWDDTTLILSGLGNLSDRSFVGRFDYRVRVLTYVNLLAFAAVHVGARGGEFRFSGTLPSERDQFRLAILEKGWSEPVADAVAARLSGTRRQIAPPLVDIGLALSVDL